MNKQQADEILDYTFKLGVRLRILEIGSQPGLVKLNKTFDMTFLKQEIVDTFNATKSESDLESQEVVFARAINKYLVATHQSNIPIPEEERSWLTDVVVAVFNDQWDQVERK